MSASTSPASNLTDHRGSSTGMLRRELGVFGATMMGLGSIIGTGVFVSIGIAVDAAGAGVLPAILISVLIATCNALSSAELAAAHPVSGGTYEYGYQYLSPWLGFTAGWMFLCAKTASAATAALGFSGYFAAMTGVGDGWRIPLANGVIAVLTLVVLLGIRQSSWTNIVIVCVTLSALATFCVAGLPVTVENGGRALRDFLSGSRGSACEELPQVLNAAALMFVAFTGYSRIATLGEEVRHPERTIPRAIVVTLGLSAVLYLAVATVLVSLPATEVRLMDSLSRDAPLESAAQSFGAPAIATLVAIGAMTAMLGVLLNLLLGLSRVLLAMGRRGDAPRQTAVLNALRTTPYIAVMVVGTGVAALTLVGDIKTTWSFSAFTVLIYYAITNLAALRMPARAQRYPTIISVCGLLGCLMLAFWVEWRVWLTGIGLIVAGLIWHGIAQRDGSHPAHCDSATQT
jgi:APA family basic amino acid/polyamine antiporter